jgi:hypothetical protein
MHQRSTSCASISSAGNRRRGTRSCAVVYRARPHAPNARVAPRSSPWVRFPASQWSPRHPSRFAAQATPCAWFPLETPTTPLLDAPRPSGLSIRCHAPRILKAPMGCSISGLHHHSPLHHRPPAAASGVGGRICSHFRHRTLDTPHRGLAVRFGVAQFLFCHQRPSICLRHNESLIEGT